VVIPLLDDSRIRAREEVGEIAMTLFEDMPKGEKKSKKAKKAPETDGAVARLFEVYRQEFRRKWNPCAVHKALGCTRCGDEWAPKDAEHEVKPLIEYGRDGKSLKNLKDAWGEEAVTDLIRDFFASTDPQITSRDYKIAVLFQHAQRLRLRAQQGGLALDRRTAENVDAAHRAMRRTP
jgi:hypothetical protein